MVTKHAKSGDFIIFNICSKLEARFAELYHYYGDIFSEDFYASKLWKKVALEEENHLRQFEVADRLYRWSDFEVTVDLERAQRICNKMDTLLEHVRQTPPSLETALTKAIEMEEAIAYLHMTTAVKFADESIQNLFKAMAGSDLNHIQSLKDYLTVIHLSRTDMGR